MNYVSIGVETGRREEAKQAGVLPDFTLLEIAKERGEALACSPAQALQVLREVEGDALTPNVRFLLSWPFTTSGLFEPGGPRDGEEEGAYTCLALLAWRAGIHPFDVADLLVANEEDGLLSWNVEKNRYDNRVTLPFRLRDLPKEKLRQEALRYFSSFRGTQDP